MKAAPVQARVALRDYARTRTGSSSSSQVGLEVPWRPVVDGWPEDLRAEFEERAAIMEFDGHAPRALAERKAYEFTRAAHDVARLMGEGRK